MLLLLLMMLMLMMLTVGGQGPPEAVTSTSSIIPTQTQTPANVIPYVDGANCSDAVNHLVSITTPCFDGFKSASPRTPPQADAAALLFINCICSLPDWVAGSQYVFDASFCPPPYPLGQGAIAAIATECSPVSQGYARNQLISSFHLNISTPQGMYVPLSGYAPGSSPSSASTLPRTLQTLHVWLFILTLLTLAL